MLARVTTFSIAGLDTRRVTVEVDIRPGLPGFVIVGLGDAAVREARERVRAAVLNSGFEFPLRRIVANLAPAHLRKGGSGFDLAIACGILAASGQVPPSSLARWAVFGELSLTGELRGTRGALAVAEGTRRAELPGLIIPRDRAREAALVDEIEIAGVRTLHEVGRVLTEGSVPALPAAVADPERSEEERCPDLQDVRGHHVPIQALRIAAAGGHNVLLRGAPGSGKTMLARRMPSILPPLTRDESVEVTRIHSLAGISSGEGLVTRRPFRAPHHSISASGLVGGGAWPLPGEATLAHHGVLFLDELSEFSRPAIEALRQPLEDGHAAIIRGQQTAVFPTRFMLVAATNPCPCGFASEPRRCRCSQVDLQRYVRRLSGPLMDRIDLVHTVERPSAEALAAPPTATSAAVRADVEQARDRQARRLAGTAARCNAHMDAALVRQHAWPDEAGQDLLALAYARDHISARGHDRVLKVARTIADLEGSDAVGADHVAQALSLRGAHQPAEVLA